MKKIIDKLEKDGHFSASRLLERWQRIIDYRLKNDLEGLKDYMGESYAFASRDFRDFVIKAPVEEIERRAIGIAAFHYPELKDYFNV